MVSCSTLRKNKCKSPCEWIRNKGCRNVCPEGKKLNKKTDRCVKIKKEKSPIVKNKKKCPEGKVYYSPTKRCRKIKTAVTKINKAKTSPQIIGKKKCPEGKVYYSPTKRCRKIKIAVTKTNKPISNILPNPVKSLQCISPQILAPDGKSCVNIQLIDKGTYGCVVTPPISEKKYIVEETIPYKNNENNDIAKIYIHGSSEYEKELSILKEIEKIDPNSVFTVQLKGALKFSGESINRHSQLLKCLKKPNLTISNVFYEIILENGGMKVNSKYQISYKAFLSFFRIFLKGMVKLQQKGLVHRDIKPANVLINKHKINLIDFGLLTRADKVYDAKYNYILSYFYPYYPPEFFIASILLKYQNNINVVIDNIINIMEDEEYFEQNFMTNELLLIYKSGIDRFIRHIKTNNFTKYNEIFTEQLALKTDVFSLAHIIKSFNDNITYKSNNEKSFINMIYMICIDCNPYTRTSIENLFNIVDNEYKAQKQITGAGKQLKLKQTFVDKTPFISDYISPKV